MDLKKWARRLSAWNAFMIGLLPSAVVLFFILMSLAIVFSAYNSKCSKKETNQRECSCK